MRYFILFLIYFIFACGLNIYGQTGRTTPDLKKEKVEIKKTELKNVDTVYLSRGSGGGWIRRSSALDLSERDKELIAMDPEDRRNFASFLEEEKTGFVRLHDWVNCDEKSVIINVAEPCPWNILGKATSYSFRKGKYQRTYFSDIRIKNSFVEVVGVNLVGFLTILGDIELNKLTLQSAGIKELAEFNPTNDVKEAEKLYVLSKRGFQLNDFIYKNALPIKENTTYALRCIAYDGKIYAKVNRFKVNLLENDKRGDVTIVFRVIRKHEDESYSILWKELQRKDAPKLKSEKQILK